MKHWPPEPGTRLTVTRAGMTYPPGTLAVIDAPDIFPVPHIGDPPDTYRHLGVYAYVGLPQERYIRGDRNAPCVWFAWDDVEPIDEPAPDVNLER